MNTCMPILILLLFISACASHEKVVKPKDWKEESQKLAKEYAYAIGTLDPEYVAELGFSAFDSMTSPYSKDREEKSYVMAYKWQKRLERFLEEAQDPELRTDANILLANTLLDMERIELTREAGIVPFMPLSEFVYSNLKSLLKPDAPKTKIHSGLIRFRQYVRGTDSQLPLVDGFMAHMLNRMTDLATRRKRGFWPDKKEILSYLKESDEYLKEIEDLLKVWPGEQWKRDMKEFRSQEASFREFLRKKVLPYARSKSKTPPEVYAFSLKEYGILENARTLIKTGKKDFIFTYNQFEKLAFKIAHVHNLPESDPVYVVKYLEAKKFIDDDKLMNFYQSSLQRLLKIVTTQHLLTLKEKPDISIRFGTQAEMQAIPAPHFDSPPLMEEGGSEKGQYIIPRTSGEYGMKDFSFKEAIINLTAHEAVPGHALQYQSMKERGISLIRSEFAFKSANVEGWAHYAEGIVFPYLSLEEKFITLQRRLWRQARMFLDPELNLGLIKPSKVLEVYLNQLGFSREFANSELKRYSYLMPGQAPAYYYGYKILIGLKEKLKQKLGTNFSESCFNNAVLGLGVIPLAEIHKRLMDSLSCDPE